MRDVGLTYPVSEVAEPPIYPHDTRGAPTALCPTHGSRLVELNVAGQVYLCPQGQCYWRAGKGAHGMHRPLAWPKGM